MNKFLKFSNCLIRIEAIELIETPHLAQTSEPKEKYHICIYFTNVKIAEYFETESERNTRYKEIESLLQE